MSANFGYPMTDIVYLLFQPFFCVNPVLWILSKVLGDSLQPTRPQNFKMDPQNVKISINHYLLRQLSPRCRSFEVKGEWKQTQQAKFSCRLATKSCFFSTSYVNRTQFCDELDKNLVNKN